MTLRKPSELSARIAVPESTLAQWRYRKIGPAYVKVGPHHVRYRDEDVDAWLCSHTVDNGLSGAGA